MYRTMTMRQTLPSRVVLNTTQGGIAAVLCGVEYDREANSGGSLRRDDEREMPRCSQHEWRHQRGKGNKIVSGLLYGFRLLSGGLLYGVRILSGGLLYGFRLLSGGLLYGFRLLSGVRKLGRWAFDPITGQVYPKETTDSFLSRQEHGVCLLVLVVVVRTCIIRL